MLVHALFASIVLSNASGDVPEWGGFRGNNGCGVADTEAMPAALDKEKNLAWRVEIPAGYSSPVVAGDRVFVTAAEDQTLSTICIDRKTGEERWRREVEFDGKRPGANSSAAPTPATDGERVYAVFHALGVVAYEVDGEEAWEKPMDKFHIPHGMSTSPLLFDDLVILQVDQDRDAHLIALEKATGDVRWRVERPGVTHSYATPALYEPEEGPPQVIVSGSYRIAGYNARTGEQIWWIEGSAWQSKCVPVIDGNRCIVAAYMVPSAEFGVPKMSGTWAEALEERDEDGDELLSKEEWASPIMSQIWFIFDLDDDGLMNEREYDYAASTHSATGGLFAIRLDGKGDVTKTHVEWKYGDRRGLPDCPSPLLYDGLLYLIKEGGLLTTVDPATGEKLKQERVGRPDKYFASPVAGAGKVLFASQAGDLTVIESGKDWKELSVNGLDEDLWATPAIVGGQVIVRTQEALYCFNP